MGLCLYNSERLYTKYLWKIKYEMSKIYLPFSVALENSQDLQGFAAFFIPKRMFWIVYFSESKKEVVVATVRLCRGRFHASWNVASKLYKKASFF